MFANIVQAMETAVDTGHEITEVFRQGRATGIRNFIDFSNISQAKLASLIGSSATYVAKISSQPIPLEKFIVSLTQALALPDDCLSSPDDLMEFHQLNPVYAGAIDALLTHRPSAGQSTSQMPTDFILAKIASYSYSTKNVSVRDNLTKYFQSPVGSREPDLDEVQLLERALGLPPESITAPWCVMARKDLASQLSLATRSIIADNLEHHMEQRSLTSLDMAQSAGVPEISVKKLLSSNHNCTFVLIMALAAGLEVEPASFFVPLEDELEAKEDIVEPVFKGVPLVARDLIIRYVKLIKERSSDELPSSRLC